MYYLYIDEHITLASNVSSCAILGFSIVVVVACAGTAAADDDGGDNIVCKIINDSLNEKEFIRLSFMWNRNLYAESIVGRLLFHVKTLTICNKESTFSL